MNQGQATGVYWAVAAAMLAAGLFVSWPDTSTTEGEFDPGQALFENFKDPLAATSLKMVTFDEEQGQVGTFEVRRDRETGEWTIPSRKGYPADAVEQMKDAANSLVGLQLLDVQTVNAEDHEALGVVEPKLEDLEVGDVGVGRLVTFKDESQNSLASLIIGHPVKDEDGKVYVRKPGQDPVYVVKLDEAALSTKFQDWIEDDLLQMSSIDVKEMAIKDYTASIGGRGEISLTRNYTAEVSLDGSDWNLDRLLEYPSENPLADPKEVSVDPSQVVNKEKLNDIKNALDDLKIVDVVRKPDGMSANLRADKNLISDNEAVSSLASRGFFPVSAGAKGEFEVLSANGELTVTIDDGVRYVLRFGNVSGLSDEGAGESEDEDGEESSTGVNRYLLVTTVVDEAQFPAPELKPVPQTIEELEAMLGEGEEPEAEEGTEAAAKTDPMPAKTAPAEEKKEQEKESAKKSEDETTKDKPADKKMTEEKADKMTEEKEADKTDSPTEQTSAEEADAKQPAKKEMKAEDQAKQETEPKPKAESKPETESKPEAKPEPKKTSKKPAATEEVEVNGSGEATGEGQGNAPAEGEVAEGEDVAAETAKTDKAADATDEEYEASVSAEQKQNANPNATDEAMPERADAPTEDESGEVPFSKLSDDEKQERLEAEQEKILKENTRLLDERKDRLAAAKRRVSDLNARFADWYYVIPEATYSKLRIKREELLTSKEEEETGDTQGNQPVNLPQFGAPGN